MYIEYCSVLWNNIHLYILYIHYNIYKGDYILIYVTEQTQSLYIWNNYY